MACKYDALCDGGAEKQSSQVSRKTNVLSANKTHIVMTIVLRTYNGVVRQDSNCDIHRQLKKLDFVWFDSTIWLVCPIKEQSQ